jgi:hypothetical protein
MPATGGRIRKGGDKGFQGVSMADNWRTAWFKNEETAQKHLDEHIAKLDGKKPDTKKTKGNDGADKNAETTFVEQDASDIPPGGQNTGPRG